jgi:putative transposase
MKSDTLAQLLATLGVTRSFSRPHVSDDNAFSEAHFKTLKYQPDYPGRFTGEAHARGWLAPFFWWHNDECHHASPDLFTPADVFLGRVENIRSIRQAALDAIYTEHPERFPNGPPVVRLPPALVEINPLTADAVVLPTPSLPLAEELKDGVRATPTKQAQTQPAHTPALSQHAASTPRIVRLIPGGLTASTLNLQSQSLR